MLSPIGLWLALMGKAAKSLAVLTFLLGLGVGVTGILDAGLDWMWGYAYDMSFAEALANLFNSPLPPSPVGGDGIGGPFPVHVEGPGAVDVIRNPEIEVPKRPDMTLSMKVLAVCSLVVFFSVCAGVGPVTAIALLHAQAYVMSDVS